MIQGFLAIRKHADRILLLAEVMQSALSPGSEGECAWMGVRMQPNRALLPAAGRLVPPSSSARGPC